MIANELRINNIVYGVSDRIEKVTYITERYVKTNLLKLDAESQILGIENLTPIPLTEEWLLKFGFEKKGSFYRIKNSRFAEVIAHYEGIDVRNHSVCLDHIKYVHQLQNLYFALTNEELTIKL